jgi:hypothetical protein
LESVKTDGIKSLGARLREGDPKAVTRLDSYSRFIKGNRKRHTVEEILKAVRNKREHDRAEDAIFGFPHKVDMSKSERLREWLKDKTPVKVDIDKLKRVGLLDEAVYLDAPAITYDRVSKIGPALSNIPHPRIITKDGVIPSDYLKVLNKEAALNDSDIETIYNKYYKDTDGAHGVPHIEAVRAAAKDIATRRKYNKTKLLDAAAVLHDIGNKTDRDTHEIIGAGLIKKDPIINTKFKPRELAALVHAVREHRASTGKPKTQLAKILSDSDRLSSFDHPGSSLLRAYRYGLKHEPGITHEQNIFRSAEHQNHKYGPGGYGLAALNFPESKEHILRINKPVIDAYNNKDITKLKKLLEAAKKREKR